MMEVFATMFERSAVPARHVARLRSFRALFIV